MKPLRWLSNDEFEVGGVRFRCTLGDYAARTTEDHLVILKTRSCLEQYASVFADLAPRTMFEFGIFQGGSPALFSAWFELDKFVGVDVCAPVAEFDRFCSTHEVGRRIRTYYATSQTDRPRIEGIIRDEFGATPIDAIIDDASHSYGATRRAFEIAFPFLRPGGIYVIEDWGWAHWPHNTLYRGQTALSMLIMELLMACASRSDVISEVRVFPAFAFVRKAPHAPAMTELRLDRLYQKRGIALVGSRNLHLAAAAQVVAEGLAGRARRAISRAKSRLFSRS